MEEEERDGYLWKPYVTRGHSSSAATFQTTHALRQRKKIIKKRKKRGLLHIQCHCHRVPDLEHFCRKKIFFFIIWVDNSSTPSKGSRSKWEIYCPVCVRVSPSRAPLFFHQKIPLSFFFTIFLRGKGKWRKIRNKSKLDSARKLLLLFTLMPLFPM